MEKKLTSFNYDLLNRKDFAVNLTNIIEQENDMNVIAIDSDWGTGKTTFVKMWNNMLLTDESYKDKFETLYFNAWENDYIKDPLVAFISEIGKQIEEEKSTTKKGLRYIKDNGKELIKPLVKTGLKLATNGLLNLDQINLGKFNEDEITKLASELGDTAISEIIKKKEIRGHFIDELKEYVKDNNINIIFFIDELDRCRPSFAIALLEVIKHLFSVDRITFIISVDKEQLAYSISTLYGQGMDSDGYLRRFFDLEYKMPIPDKRKYIELKNKIIFKNYQNTGNLQMFLRELFIRDMYSLRDIDKAYNYIKLLIPTIAQYSLKNDTKYGEIYIIIFNYILAEMIDIKIKHSSIYKKIIDLDYSTTRSDIQSLLNFNKLESLYLDIQNINEKKIKELIFPALGNYLLAINLTNNGEKVIRMTEEEENSFIVGLKDDNGNYYNYWKINILSLVREKEFNIIKKMEFLDNLVM